MPAWFKPLISGGWQGSYAGSGVSASFVREDVGGNGGVTCAEVS